MARFSIDENGNDQQEQHSYPTLPLAKLQKLETLSLYYNLPEAAIICTKCGFALSPKRASEHPGKKHGIARSARHGLKPFLSSLNLPDPDALALLYTHKSITPGRPGPKGSEAKNTYATLVLALISPSPCGSRLVLLV
ncbi:hypothetical protein MRS44_013154 [Fusarium solani]|uniref:uncharacterized protein n=1 Tax=Fusarium solani TaxID=169388 RepID=UPI0032C492BB|nr:hypothetical protein MRS44_013154 [Fusarium solani]